MARTAFKLKSQGSSFKAMGATPGESPAKLGGLYKLGKLIYRGITGTRKIKKNKGLKKTYDYLTKTKKSGRTKQAINNADDLARAHNAKVRQIPVRYTPFDVGVDYGTYKGVDAWFNPETEEINKLLPEVEVTPDSSTTVWDDDSTATETITPKKDTTKNTLKR
jgi:hypothetical protein